MIIVTGGAGFIGSALVWRLNQEGINDIVIVDDLGQENKWKNLVKRNFREVVGIDSFFTWLAANSKHHRIDAVFHMGACSSTVEKDVDYLYRNNVDYSIKAFEFCSAHNIPFLYASSAATYGAEEQDFSDEDAGLRFRSPINPYGFSKELFDRWVMKQTAFPAFWAGYKFFNVYGPNEYHKGGQSSVVFQAYPQIKNHNQLKLFKSYRKDVGDGEQKRDFVYVKDVVEVMVEMYKRRDQCSSGIYNLGSGKAQSFNALADAAFEAMGYNKNKVVYMDMPEQLINQYQYFTEASLEKLRKQGFAGFKFTSLGDGVADYIQNYLAKEDPYL